MQHVSEFPQFAGFAFLAALVIGCAAQSPEDPGWVDSERPNVLMIVVDDLNDWVGYTGTNPDTRTPHIDALKRSPYAQNTIVVLFSDHGYLLGEKNTYQKHSLWERANRVPLIIAGPNVPRGEIREQTVGLIDIYPTLLELAGLPSNPANEGRSLTPVLGDADSPWDYPAVTQWRRSGPGGPELRGQAIQSGTWRYSLYGDGSEELYSHEGDPHEWTNLADGYAQETAASRFLHNAGQLNQPVFRPMPRDSCDGLLELADPDIAKAHRIVVILQSQRLP